MGTQIPVSRTSICVEDNWANGVLWGRTGARGNTEGRGSNRLDIGFEFLLSESTLFRTQGTL